MLGTLRMDVDECIEAYKTLFESVFGQKKRHFKWNLRGNVQSIFSSKALELAIKEVVIKSGRKADAKFNEGVGHDCKV